MTNTNTPPALSQDLDLDALVDALPVRQERIEHIDVSHIFDKPDGSVFFSYKELSVFEMHRAISESVQYVQAHNLDWSQELATVIFIIAMAHSHPMPKSKSRADIYAKIVTEKPGAYLRLQGEFIARFPVLFNLKEAAISKKNGGTKRPKPGSPSCV